MAEIVTHEATETEAMSALGFDRDWLAETDGYRHRDHSIYVGFFAVSEGRYAPLPRWFARRDVLGKGREMLSRGDGRPRCFTSPMGAARAALDEWE